MVVLGSRLAVRADIVPYDRSYEWELHSSHVTVQKLNVAIVDSERLLPILDVCTYHQVYMLCCLVFSMSTLCRFAGASCCINCCLLQWCGLTEHLMLLFRFIDYILLHLTVLYR